MMKLFHCPNIYAPECIGSQVENELPHPNAVHIFKLHSICSLLQVSVYVNHSNNINKIKKHL